MTMPTPPNHCLQKDSRSPFTLLRMTRRKKAYARAGVGEACSPPRIAKRALLVRTRKSPTTELLRE